MISRGKLFCSVCLFIVSATSSFSQSPTDNRDQTLYFASWQGSFLSQHRNGSACWILNSDGNLRFEVMVGGSKNYPLNRDQLLGWSGAEGYTVVSVDSGGGTYSRWFEKWQPLTQSWDTWLRVIIGQTSGVLELPAEVLDVSPGGRSLILPMFADATARTRVKRLQLPRLNHKKSSQAHSPAQLRQKMTSRGLGRGGQESILSLSVSGADHGIRITSSHLPVTLQLDRPVHLAAEFSPEEVFLPWWPLVQTLRLK